MPNLRCNLRPVHVLPLLLIAAAAGCGDTVGDEPQIASTSQQMRSGVTRSGDALVGVDVLVTDSSGQGVRCGEGTVEVDLEVSRNGTSGPWKLVDRHAIDNSCSDDAAGDLALVFDNSASIGDSLGQMKEAVAHAADTIVGLGGKVSLVRVSTDSTQLTGLSDDLQTLGEGIDGMWVTNGWSALWDGVRMGNESFAGDLAENEPLRFDGSDAFCSSTRKRGILVFTDGGENNSSHQQLRNEDYPGDGIDTTLDDVAGLRVGSDATPIYTVGLGDKLDAEGLRELSERTGGRYIHMDSMNALDSVLQSVTEYFGASQRFCAQVPSHLCGSLDVRVTHRWTNGSETSEGVRQEHVDIPCDARAKGRIATILMTLAATDADADVIDKLVANTVNWVSPVDAPRVLFVLDGDHHREFSHDPAMLYLRFTMAGYAASYLDEPKHGLTLEDVDDYDVVWFSNPGHPMNDPQTRDTLVQFSRDGGGVVLQGDDMSAPLGRAFDMRELTGLEHINNGTQYCSKNTDNGTKGKSDGTDTYTVTFGAGPHPILEGIEGATLVYDDDIDTAKVVPPTAEVLATATVPQGNNRTCEAKPVIVAYTPDSD